MIFREFIITYILLGVIAAILIALLVLVIILLHRSSNDIPVSSFVQNQSGTVMPNSPQSMEMPPVMNVSAANSGVAVCRNCGMQFDSANKFCPKCGTSRN